VSNPSVVQKQLPASVSNGIALSQTLAAAGALTLNGSLVTSGVANLAVAQRVGIASTGNEGATVFTIVGTNVSNAPIGETVTGVNADTVNSLLDYLTVTSITMSAPSVGNITVGTVGVGSTEWVLLDIYARYWAVAIAVQILSGSLNYTVEHTYDDVNTIAPATPQQWSTEPRSNVPPVAWKNNLLNGSSNNGETQYANQPVMAVRLTINSGTGKAQMQTIQAGAPGPS
jgi:hypothetical protein